MHILRTQHRDEITEAEHLRQFICHDKCISLRANTKRVPVAPQWELHSIGLIVDSVCFQVQAVLRHETDSTHVGCYRTMQMSAA